MEHALNITSKEMVLPQQELDSFTSEQRAAIDFLVLTNCNKFVGHSASSMSFLVQEFRRLNGHPKETSILVEGHPNMFLFSVGLAVKV